MKGSAAPETMAPRLVNRQAAITEAIRLGGNRGAEKEAWLWRSPSAVVLGPRTGQGWGRVFLSARPRQKPLDKAEELE